MEVRIKELYDLLKDVRLLKKYRKQELFLKEKLLKMRKKIERIIERGTEEVYKKECLIKEKGETQDG